MRFNVRPISLKLLGNLDGKVPFQQALPDLIGDAR
jgi:hypothetical protein